MHRESDLIQHTQQQRHSSIQVRNADIRREQREAAAAAAAAVAVSSSSSSLVAASSSPYSVDTIQPLYSRRADSSIIPLHSGCGVPRDYDSVPYSSNECYENGWKCGPDISTSFLGSLLSDAENENEDEDYGENRTWTSIQHMRVRAFETEYAARQIAEYTTPNTKREYRNYFNPGTYKQTQCDDSDQEDEDIDLEHDELDGGESEEESYDEDEGEEQEQDEEKAEQTRQRKRLNRRLVHEEEESQRYHDDPISSDDDDLPPHVLTTYEHDIQPEVLPRVERSTNLPLTLCDIVCSYLDPDSTLGLLLEETIVTALRVLETVLLYSKEAQKFGEVLPEPHGSTLLEELPPKARELVVKAVERKKQTTIARGDGISHMYSTVNPYGYPTRLYLSPSCRRALRELEIIFDDEINPMLVRQFHCFDTKTGYAGYMYSDNMRLNTQVRERMERVRNVGEEEGKENEGKMEDEVEEKRNDGEKTVPSANSNPQPTPSSLPPLSRSRLSTLLTIFHLELDSWESVFDEMESRLEVATEEWSFASRVLQMADYLLISRPESSGIRPKKPFFIREKGVPHQWELMRPSDRVENAIKGELKLGGGGSEEKKEVNDQSDNDESMKDATVDSEAAGDVTSAEVSTESAYIISPINGIAIAQESSHYISTTLTPAINSLSSYITHLNSISPQPSPRYKRTKQKRPTYGMKRPEPTVPTATELQIQFPRVQENRREFIREYLVKEYDSITAKAWCDVIAQEDGVMDAANYYDAVTPLPTVSPSHPIQGTTHDACVSRSSLSVLNNRLMQNNMEGEEYESDAWRGEEHLHHVDVEQYRAKHILNQAWTWMKYLDPHAEEGEKGEVEEQDEYGREEALELGRLIQELVEVKEIPTYVYGGVPKPPTPSSTTTTTSAIPHLAASSSSATAVPTPTSASSFCVTHDTDTEMSDVSATSVSASSSSPFKVASSIAPALSATSILSNDEDEGDDNSSSAINDSALLYTGEPVILRRIMTSRKHRAAGVLVGYLDSLRNFMHQHVSDYYERLPELTQLVDCARIALAHYYLLHMSRSESLDDELVSLNQHYLIMNEQSNTLDPAIDRHLFGAQIHEQAADYKNGVRFTNAALSVLQEFGEQEVVRLLSAAMKAKETRRNRHAITAASSDPLLSKDLQLVSHIQRDANMNLSLHEATCH